MPFIPVNEPLLDGNELRYLTECISSGWISSEGPFVEKFEKSFAEYVQREHCITVSNGSDAMDLSLSVANLSEGDEVILPTFTIVSCVNAVLRVGAKPVLVDADPETWNMDVPKIEEKITEKTAAIMVVHIYGLPVDMEPVERLCEKYELALIEDAAEAIGLRYRDRPCGSFGNISTFSFYANKLVAMGEGGLVATNDTRIAENCRSLHNLDFREPRFIHDRMGWNMRLTNIQAAVGLAQLERLGEFIVKKKRMGRLYTDLLSRIEGIRIPVVSLPYAENVYWVFGVILDQTVPFDAQEAQKRLAAKNIGTRPFFWPMHLQPVFAKMGLFENESYPVSENLGKRGFYLPCGLAITDDQIETVAESLQSILN